MIIENFIEIEVFNFILVPTTTRGIKSKLFNDGRGCP